MKSTIDIPDALLKEAKLKALEDSTTLKGVVISALQAYLFEDNTKGDVFKEEATKYGSHIRIDDTGFPVLAREDDDDTVVTDEFINEMREELGV